MTSQTDLIDMKARSREGRGLSQRAGEKWIEIQKNTFMNWVNLQLQSSGLSISDFETDFDDGVRLCALVEALQNKKIGRVIKKPMNQHQSLENVTLALRAIAEDNVRLVNIGSEDIVNGSLKLILGLVWHLILRYQIGKTKVPPKKLMIAWLQAVVPDLHIRNFTSDWNDGVALHALIEYCQPGLCPNWRQLSRHSKLENCAEAMELARDHLNIPIVVRPEDFSSPHLDELSGMTYLSYFMMVDSPGYFATRREIRALLQHGTIDNFTTDWNDGHLLCNTVKSIGGHVPGWPSLTDDHIQNLQTGIDSARQFGIEPIFSAKEMADPEVEHLGIMAYAAYFRKFSPVESVAKTASFNGNFDNVHVKQEHHFTVQCDGCSPSDVKTAIYGPDSIVVVRTDWSGDKADCYFTPIETGQHKLSVSCDDQPIGGCPVSFRVLSDRSKVKFDLVDKAYVGKNSELKVDTSDAGDGEVRMEALSPSGHVTNMPVMYRKGVHSANFTPTEVGEWQISTIYEGEHVEGSPHYVRVIDPSLVRITDLSAGKVGEDVTFNADTSMAGEGDLRVECFHNEQNVPCYLDLSEGNRYHANFVPKGPGSYKIYAYMNDVEVRGSPYTVDIVDSTRVYVTGDGLSLVPVNTSAIFTVHTEGAGGGQVDIDITGPRDEVIEYKLTRSNSHTYDVEYVPTYPGEYTVNVQFGGQNVQSSPFVAKAFDSNQLSVYNMPTVSSKDVPVTFNIDASQAGSGNIEIRVNEGRVPCNVENNGNHRFAASFWPENCRPHTIEMSFNDRPVEGSPWVVNVIDPASIALKGEEWVPINKPTSIRVRIASKGQGFVVNNLDINITDPHGEKVPYKLLTDNDGERNISYTPTSIGDYNVSVKYGESDVSGSPFTCKAYNMNAIVLSRLEDGFVGQAMSFTIDVSDAGEGQLQIMVNNGNIPNDVEPKEPGKYKIIFVPQTVGRQQVDIRFNDLDLAVSPLVCHALDLSAQVVDLDTLIPVTSENTFSIKSQSNMADISKEVVITGPHGQRVPAKILRTGDSRVVDVEYVPTDIGTHTVKALLNGQPIKGSPFHVKTFDPNMVKVTRVKQGIVGSPCTFTVDASQAGEGTMEISITNNGQIVPNRAKPLGNNVYEITFFGERAGNHKISVTYNGLHVQGSPYNVPMLDVSDMQLMGDNWHLISCHRPSQLRIRQNQASLSDLNVKIIGPDGSNVPCHLSERSDGTIHIDWHPSKIGTHKLYVDCCGVPIKGSPFSMKVYDSSRVRVSDIKTGMVGKQSSFTLDASEAGDGNLEILVMCDEDIVPNYVREEGNTKFRVQFTPKRAGLHLVHVQFNGEAIKGSPYQCQVFNPDSVFISGEGINMAAASHPTSFMVNMKNAGDAKLNVRVISPHGEDIPVHVTGSPHTGIKIDYTPHHVGQYRIHVDCEGVPVNGSPYTCNVFDPSQIRINAPGRAYFGKPIHFHLDTSAAGQAKVDFQVKCRGVDVPIKIRETALDRFDVSFTPQNVAPHHVTVLYNNMLVPGTPFEVPVIDSSSVSVAGDGLRLAKIYKESRLTLDHQGLDERDVDVRVVGPSGNLVPARLSNRGNAFHIDFTPLEVGSHKINVEIGDMPMNGSPFYCNVYDPSAVRIIEIDKTRAKEREIGFTIDSSSASAGALEVLITHKGQPVHAECRKVAEGRHMYTFKPLNVGRYEVKATFNGETIPGSPLIIEVEEDRPTFIRINMSSSEPINTQGKNWFLLHTSGRHVEHDMLSTVILAPNGEKIPARLIQQPDGDYKVEWTPDKPGRHAVDVLYGGQQIQGSPFYIDVFDMHKIRVNNFYSDNVGDKAGFKIDCTQAGQGEQEVRIVSPSGRNVPFQIDESIPLEYNISYTPIEVGTHKAFISYSGMDLNGSPFHQEIFEGVLPPATGDGLHRGEEDKAAVFFVDSRGMQGEPSVQVEGPNSIAKCSIEPQPDGQYKVTYVPTEVGLFNAEVRWNGKEIPGSPFHPKIVDARKVRVVGGWQHYMDSQERVHLVVAEEKQIPFDTSDAGPGQLRAEVKSPSAFIPVSVDDEQKGKSVVKFVPKEEGNHYIHLYWNDHPLVNSPYLGYATSGMADPSKVWLSGRGLKEGVVMEENEFFIDGSQAGPGEPEVELTGVRAEVRVFTTRLGGGKYRCTYIPKIPGAYLLHISWNGRQLRGSPYKVNVIGASYPSRVVVNGEGLKGGLLGQNLDFRIDTRRAGPGELTAYCMGPSQVAYCELSDHHDGTYKLAVRAQEVGRHVLQIKYGGEHVQGSPYSFKVSAQPDASKVRVSGPGVEHGLLANFQSQFIVETKGAGAGQLTVRIRGPRGAFQVEMYRESQKDRTILCRYYPTVTGLYVINVRWSGIDVPGSPFHVNILDTQQELEQILNEQSLMANGHHPNFHNISSNSINHNRVAHNFHQTAQTNHNTSRNSGGYYQWHE